MDHETLSTWLSDKPVSAVASCCGVHRRTVYRWCRKFGILRRVYRCPDQILLRRLEANCILQKNIAAHFGVSRWTIRLWCKKFGIAHHTTGRFRKGMKGNVSHLHHEMPFGIGIAFGADFD